MYRMIPKTEFVQCKNDQIDAEPFIWCQRCDRKWHQICAQHDDKIYPGGFICPTCRKETQRPLPENRYTAKRNRFDCNFKNPTQSQVCRTANSPSTSNPA